MPAQTTIQVRRGTASSWTSTNPTLAAGEVGFETDTGKFKIGTGSTVWTGLAYSSILPNTVTTKGDLLAATGSATVDRLAAGANGYTLVADSSTSTGLAYSPTFFAGKNKIINGDFGIWQRGTSLSGAGYLADRFQGVVTTTTITQSQQTFTPGTAPVAGYEGNFFYRAVTTSGATAGSRALVQQPIEDVRTFAGQTVTVSFWAKAASGTPKIGVELAQVFGSGGSSAVTAIGATAVTISTSWARYTVTASVPSISGKTIGTGSSLNLVLWIDAGSDFATRASSIGNQSGTFDIWGLQVEAGSTATPFTTATGTIQGELAACQRYYWRSGGTASNQTLSLSNGAYSTTGFVARFINPVQMRVAPTSLDISTCALSDDANANIALSATPTVDGNSSPLISIAVTAVASGLTQYRPYTLRTDASTSGYIGFSAEL